MPPLWSECQCESTMRSMRSGFILSAAMLRAMLRDSGPVSKSVVCVSDEPSTCVSYNVIDINLALDIQTPRTQEDLRSVQRTRVRLLNQSIFW